MITSLGSCGLRNGHFRVHKLKGPKELYIYGNIGHQYQDNFVNAHSKFLDALPKDRNSIVREANHKWHGGALLWCALGLLALLADLGFASLRTLYLMRILMG